MMMEKDAVSNAVKLAKTSTKGGFTLFWGVAISSIISALGVMIVAGILEEGEYGIVAIALTAPNLLILIRDLGIDQSTIKYTAQYKQENKLTEIKNIIIAGITFEFLLGIILSVLSYLFSGYIALKIFNRPDIVRFIQIASFSIFGNALFKMSDSAFIGYEKMQYHSISLLIQSSSKTILMIVLVISNFGVRGAVLGHTIAYLITGIAGVAILYLKIYKKLNKQKNHKYKILSTLKKMFKYGLPLSGSIILGGFLTQFYAFLIAIYLSDQIVGNYNLALNFAVLVAFFVTPVTTLLFPAFSKIDAKKDPETLRNVFIYSVKYASLLIVPAAVMVMTLSQPAVATLFPGKYELTPLYLSLYTILYVYTAFGYLSTGNLIKSQGRTDVNLKLSILNTVIAVILSLTLIPTYGVVGLISTMLISVIPTLIISLWWIKKHYNATIDYKSSIKIVLASLNAAALTTIVLFFLNISNWIILIIGAIIFLTTYLVTAPLIGAINKEDTKNLKEMLKALGPLATVFNILLNIIEKITIKFQKNNNNSTKQKY
jgi:O-antigen/teichoic acid export membrane protein